MSAPAIISAAGLSAARAPLLVVAVGPPEPLDRGPAIYRTLQPCRALGELPDVTVISGSTLSPGLRTSAAGPDRDLLTTADILVLRDVADPDFLPIVTARRRLGRLTAFEIGDHFLASPARLGPPGETPGPAELVARSVIPQLARRADCLQLGSATLAAELSSLNARRAVFPSQLWEPPSLPALRPPDRVVIGWVGSLAEREDLRSALPALLGVLERHPEVSVSVMGDPELRETLSELPETRLTFVPTASAERTSRFLDSLDIGIVPMLPTLVNRCAGDLRFLELAAHGVLAACADLEPFRAVVRPSQTGFLFRDAAALETVLERILVEPELRVAVAARAARSIVDRLERKHATARLGFYLKVAAEVGAGHHAGPVGAGTLSFPPPELLDGQHAARVFPESKYLALGAGRVEELLLEGLAHQASGAQADAHRAFAEAERLAPGSHLPPLLLGESATGTEAIEAFARAEARNPLSCRATYLRGERLLAAGETQAAAAAFERARAIAPAFGAPQERLGELAEAAGRTDDACRLYEEAALQNAAFALPIARIATLAHQDGKIDKAVGLLERSLREDPDLSLTNLLLGRAYLDLKRYNQALVHLRRALPGADDQAAVATEIAKAEAGLDGAAEAPPPGENAG